MFVIERGRARTRPVQIGAITEEEAEALSGLEAGERVIAFPPNTVQDGVAVRAR